MEQTEKLRNLIIELIKSYPGAAYPIHEIDTVISQAFEQVAKEVAIEFCVDIPLMGIFNEKISKEHIGKMFDYWLKKQGGQGE